MNQQTNDNSRAPLLATCAAILKLEDEIGESTHSVGAGAPLRARRAMLMRELMGMRARTPVELRLKLTLVLAEIERNLPQGLIRDGIVYLYTDVALQHHLTDEASAAAHRLASADKARAALLEQHPDAADPLDVPGLGEIERERDEAFDALVRTPASCLAGAVAKARVLDREGVAAGAASRLLSQSLVADLIALDEAARLEALTIHPGRNAADQRLHGEA